jgi:2'-5' RNA ligase
MWRTGGELHEVWGGRRMKPDTLHMTLVFLGDISSSHVEDLRQLADDIEARQFRLEFRQAACWRHNKVGFLSPVETPTELEQLVYGLEDSLEAAGISFDQRPYKPHVTLLRNTRCTTQVAFTPLIWTPDEFVLVASSNTDHGPIYQLLGRWKLQD